MKNQNAPSNSTPAPAAQRIRDLVTAVNELARAHGIDPEVDHDAAWRLAHLKRPELFSQQKQ
jgi:hypothetical protein